MRLNQLYSGLTFLSVFISAFGYSEEIKFGHPQMGGSGCPHGSTQAVISPDGKTLKITLDSYSVEAGKVHGRPESRANCGFAIPVQVPSGYSISISGAKFNGAYDLPPGSSSKLKVEYFFAGQSGSIITKSYNGPSRDNYSILIAPSLAGVVWSPCGASTNIRMNTSGDVKAGEATHAMMNIHEIEEFQIQWRKCN